MLTVADDVRGGIPVCWPWFGLHSADPSLGRHGFVRTLVWKPGPVCEIGDRTRIVLSCFDDDRTRVIWNFSFRLDLEITLGPSLDLVLYSTNMDSVADLGSIKAVCGSPKTVAPGETVVQKMMLSHGFTELLLARYRFRLFRGGGTGLCSPW